jgi:hypothetical protein
MEFQASLGAKVFYLSFIIAGIGVMIGMPYFAETSNGFSFETNTIIPLLIGFCFIVAGTCLFYFGTAPIVFDKTNGFFWKGRKVPDRNYDKQAVKYFAKLKHIHALQIVSEYIKSDKKSYYSYELNIVLKDGRRINVIDHGKKDKVQEDAKTLSLFLGKPVWAEQA